MVRERKAAPCRGRHSLAGLAEGRPRHSAGKAWNGGRPDAGLGWSGGWSEMWILFQQIVVVITMLFWGEMQNSGWVEQGDGASPGCPVGMLSLQP